VQVFFHMRDREAAWAASALGSGEAEQETLSEDADGGIVRRSRRTWTVPLAPAHVLENFGIGDAILSASATVTGRERRLERFRVALPGTSMDPSRSPGWTAAVLALSTALTAGLVIGAGALSSPLPEFGHTSQNVGVAQVVVSRSPAVNLPPTPTRTPVDSTVKQAATPASVSERWSVGNTDHLGVYLRVKPDGATLRAWPDNTPMDAAGSQAVGITGEVWQQVRAPDGTTGWVKQRYLLGLEQS
jgi:hypothetical protein